MFVYKYVSALWSTRQTENALENRELQIKVTLRELLVYLTFLIDLCICELFDWFTQPPMRRMRICFTDVFFCFFSVFSVRHKNTRQPFSGTAEWIFTKLLPNDRGGNVVSNFVPKWGLGPQLFFGAKNYTLCTWWWCLASESELVCWLWHWAATAVALKRHERVNAFNLVAKDATFIFFHNR